MKKLFRLLLIGLIAGITWKYLNDNDIDVGAKLNRLVIWGKKAYEQVVSSLDTESKNDRNVVSTSRSSNLPANTRPVAIRKPVASSPYENASIATKRIYTSNGTNENVVSLAEVNKPQGFDRLNNLEKVKLLTQKYSPDSWHLLMLYDQLPDNLTANSSTGGVINSPKTTSTFHYINEGPILRMLSRMSTNVHEIAHGYFSLATFTYAREKGIFLNFENAEMLLFLNPEEQYFLSFPRKKLFPSKELAARIPVSQRTFRYDTYIEGNTSTQSQGALGLLDELYAYYLGSKSNYDMLEAFQIIEGCYKKGLFTWIRNTQSTMSAFYEFDFFIREYLLWMHKQYPAHYKELISRTSFPEAYAAVYKAYGELVEDYLARIDTQMEKYNEMRPGTFHIEGDTFWYTYTNRGHKKGTSFLDADRKKLLPALNGNRYDAIGLDFLQFN